MNAPVIHSGPSWGDLKLYCGFVVIDAPSLGLAGLKYGIAGLATSRAEALKHVQKMVDRRNGLAPAETMRIETETFKFNVTEETIKEDKMQALKKLPSGMSAMELCGGEPGRVFNQSLASLMNEAEEITDINSILT